ncbi:MFS family permease [Sphingomonas jejuensis]|uniref:MFS family permease n=1 Tax=Sphingomonas jejuensis TaxID=904715 RepID=A0ABX0XMQ1_9SPHN|nr:MFS transporter [Sphingomonas jejuensis]NJC33966.1 MFS family permease [Sphingomonas jejuensis]
MSAVAPPVAADLGPAATRVDEPAAPGFRQWYLIAVLMLAYTASFIDRQVLNLLVEPLKASFDLDDTRLSLLQGLAFTGGYILFSPVFGRLADVGSRRAILFMGVGIWSVATSLCGLSQSYRQLFLARFGVGAAEACLTPAAWSIIADSFPARLIPRAFSIYMMGPYIGGGLALIFGGLLLDSAAGWDLTDLPLVGTLQPWQVVFICAGLPGLLIAAMLLAVREPPRREIAAVASQDRIPMAEVWRLFRDRRDFYLNFYAGMALLVITLYAFPAWMPAMLIRQFGMAAGDVGLRYGAAVLVTGSLGVLAGPWIAGQVERRGRADALMLVPFAACFALIGISSALLIAPSPAAALAIATLASFAYSIPQALASSALQLVTPNRMRGIASAVYVFAVSVTGLGAAPTIVAVLTDYVFADPAMVGRSLALTCAGASLLSAIFLWRALRGYRRLLRIDAGQAR